MITTTRISRHVHSSNVGWGAFVGRVKGAGRVLSSAKIGTASWRYYTQEVACRPTEYYLGVGEAPGRWHGRGLEQLGLRPGGQVVERELEALFARGLHPSTGEGLGRAWRADGVTGFDLTFSAPKSVSALWALGDTDAAVAVMAAHRAAVQATLGYLDTHAGVSRKGTDGREQVGTDGLAVALFEHRTSRCADPQLHTHALVVNKVRCADGKWRTLDAKELFHHKKSAGMLYQAVLRQELSVRLGVDFEPVDRNGQADIAGVPKELLELWSKRTAQIGADAGPKIAEYERTLGRTLTPAERVAVVKTAVLKTRPGKDHPELSALHGRWTAEAAGIGLSTDGLLASVQAAAKGQPPVATTTERELLIQAVLAAGRTRAVFSRADLAGHIAALLPTGPASGAGSGDENTAQRPTAMELVARVEELTERALVLAEAVSLGQHPKGVTARASDERWASTEVLAAEARILSLAHRGQAGGYGRVPAAVLTAAARPGLDASQQAALLQLVCHGDFVSVLTAPAGAGKTHTLGAATAAWQKAGYRVVGLAPSARAAAELAAATGGPADTLAKWLHTQARLPDLPDAGQARARLDDRTVLIVDEASMASTLDLDRLTAVAARAAAKVVLVGDPGQIGVINGPGGMLAALAHAGHGVELTAVHRFAHEWERDASLSLRRGDTRIVDVYQAAGRLHPCTGGDHALDQVFAHWAAARADGRDALMLARTRTDVDALNQRARAAADAAGELTGPVTELGERQWQAGDLLRTRRNERRLAVGDSHLRNGDRFQVLGPGPAGGLIVEDLTGRGRTILPAEYVTAYAEYGWASTIDAAQGATADVGIVLVRPGLDREHLYVGMTRGRHANHAYITLDPTADPDHHNPPTRRPDEAPQPAAQARDVLTAALGRSGAQDAAHTALFVARSRAAGLDRQQRDARAAAAFQARREAALALPPEHAATAALLEQRRAERRQLEQAQTSARQQIREARTEIYRLPRWAIGRRKTLTAAIDQHTAVIHASLPVQLRLDAEIDPLYRQVDQHTRQRQHTADRQVGTAPTRVRGIELAAPRPIEPTPARDGLGLTRGRTLGHDHARDGYLSRQHDDDRGLSR
jgi:conjugative relaxase-like TrwC/TraI family protein